MNDEFLKSHGAGTELGRIVRSADANKMLREMAKHETEVRQREQLAKECKDHIEAMVAQHRLSAEYLIMFGVPVEHRNELHDLLQEVSSHGGLTLKSAIELTNAKSVDLQFERGV